MCRALTVVTIVGLLLVSTTAFAQTARFWALGYTGIAAADDAAAIDFNPANFASLDIAPPYRPDEAGRPWDWQVALSSDVRGDLDLQGINFAGVNTRNNWGFGAAYYDASIGGWGAEYLELGFGASLGDPDWQWGVSAWREDSETSFNVGLLHQCHGRNSHAGPIKFGLVVEDVTNEYGDGPWLNAGVAVPLAAWVGADVLLSADWWGINDYSEVNVGLEWTTERNWVFRAGLNDLDEFGFGVGYANCDWRLDVSRESIATDDQVNATFSYWFK